MKILITGVSGLVGGNLAYIYSKKHQIDGIYNKNKVSISHCNTFSLDLTKKHILDSVIEKYDAIIHCASPTNLDYCEQNKLYTDEHIYGATENILNNAIKNDSFFVYISTNAVFDGKKGDYTEEDEPNPLNYYGKVKVRTEELVRSYKNHCILRIGPYGWNIRNKTSIAEWILFNLREKREVNTKNILFIMIKSKDYTSSYSHSMFMNSSNSSFKVFNLITKFTNIF